MNNICRKNFPSAKEDIGYEKLKFEIALFVCITAILSCTM